MCHSSSICRISLICSFLLGITSVAFAKKAKKQYQITYDFAAGQFVTDPAAATEASPALEAIPDNGFIREGSIVSIRYKNINPFALSTNTKLETMDHSYVDGMSMLEKLGSAAGSANTAAASDAKTAAAPIEAAKAADTVVKYPKKKSPKAQKKVEPTPGQIAIADLLDKRAKALQHFNDELTIAKQEAAKVAEFLGIDTVVNLARADISITDPPAMQGRIAANIDANVLNELKAPTAKKYFTNAVATIQSEVGSMNYYLIELDQNNALIIASDAKNTIAPLIAKMAALVEGIDAAYSGTNYAKLLYNASVIINNFSAVYNSTCEKIGSASGVANGDILVFSDEIKDAKGAVIRTIGPIKFYTCGGWRLNSSIGVAATIGEINGYEYNFKKNEKGDTTFLDASSKNRKGAFNPVVFFHAYPTLNSFISWRAITFGVGPDFADLNKTKLYLGTGIGFTPSNSLPTAVRTLTRMGLDAGITAGYADVLKEKYTGYANYAQFANVDAKDLVDRSLKVGFFIGLSFNLSAVKTTTSTTETK